jgi:hypothetical protein
VITAHPASDPVEYDLVKRLVIRLAGRIRECEPQNSILRGFIDGTLSKITVIEPRGKPTEPEIKPCPFCGGSSKITDSDGKWMVHCPNNACLVTAMTIKSDHRADAITWWNRRA